MIDLYIVCHRSSCFPRDDDRNTELVNLSCFIFLKVAIVIIVLRCRKVLLIKTFYMYLPCTYESNLLCIGGVPSILVDVG